MFFFVRCTNTEYKETYILGSSTFKGTLRTAVEEILSDKLTERLRSLPRSGTGPDHVFVQHE